LGSSSLAVAEHSPVENFAPSGEPLARFCGGGPNKDCPKLEEADKVLTDVAKFLVLGGAQ
jgi:hypothetical protein